MGSLKGSTEGDAHFKRVVKEGLDCLLDNFKGIVVLFTHGGTINMIKKFAGLPKQDHPKNTETYKLAIQREVPNKPEKLIQRNDPDWVHDSDVSDCTTEFCNNKFTIFSGWSKHHCRKCGKIFCSACCPEITQADLAEKPSAVRTCYGCEGFSIKKDPESDLPLGHAPLLSGFVPWTCDLSFCRHPHPWMSSEARKSRAVAA